MDCRVHIDYAILIVDSSTLQYCTAQRSDDIVHERISHAYVARRYRPNTQTMRTGDSYREDGNLKGLDVRRVGDRVPPHLPTQALFVPYFAHQHPPCSSRWQRVNDGSGGGKLLDSKTMPLPCPRPVVCPTNRGVRIVKVWSASVHRVWPKMHVCRRQQYAILSLQWVSTLPYTQLLIVQTCMIKC